MFVTLGFVACGSDNKSSHSRLESVGLGGFYFLQKQKVAKTFIWLRYAWSLFFGLPRKFYEFSCNDDKRCGLPRRAFGSSRNDEKCTN